MITESKNERVLRKVENATDVNEYRLRHHGRWKVNRGNVAIKRHRKTRRSYESQTTLPRQIEGLRERTTHDMT